MRLEPSLLEDSMERGTLRGQMLKHLDAVGLTSKKLAVFLPNDSDAIAGQICRDLGVICEQSHVDAVAEIIKDARSGEPVQKRLRGDVGLDPQILEERRLSLHPKFVVSDVVDSFSDDLGTRPCRRRTLVDAPEEERQKRESDQKESWSRELYKELKRMEAPALLHLEHCVDQKHIHLLWQVEQGQTR